MAENKDKKLKDDSLSAQEKEKVDEILKNLKKSKNDAKTDWDGLADISVDDEIIEKKEIVKPKKSGKKNKKEDEEIPEDELCVVCGKRRRMSKDSYYCKSCREKMKKTPMNSVGILGFFAMIILGCIAIVFGYHAINISVPIIKGDMAMAEGKYYSALAHYVEAEDYASRLNEQINKKDEVEQNTSTIPTKQTNLFDAGKRTKVKVLNVYYNIGALLSAQDYLAELESLGFTENKRYPVVKEYNDILTSFADTCAYINNQYQDLMTVIGYSGGTMQLKDIQSTLDELEKLKSDANCNKYAVAYMQYYLAAGVDDSEKVQIKYLEELKAGGKAYEEMSLNPLCMLYLETEQYEKVEKICNDILTVAPENIDYYQYLMKVKIKRNDPQGCLDIFNNVVNIVNSIYSPADPETGLRETMDLPYNFYEQKAIAHALLGQADQAIEAIDTAYYMLNDAQGQIDINTANIYALLHYEYHVKGKEPTYEGNMKTEDAVDQGYDIMLSLFTSSSVDFNSDVKAAMEGKKTLKEVFVDGEAYLQ